MIVNCTCAGVNIIQRAHDGVYDKCHYSVWEALVLMLGGDRASLKRFDEGDGDEKVNAE